MSNEQLVEKLEAWVQSHPESADTPFMNVSTGEEYSVRGLLNSLRASLAGGVQVSANMQTELARVETWIGGQ
jgi:hypothetical protein